MADINYFDIIIGSIVLLLGIKGFLNGFIKEALGLVGLVAGVFVGSRFSPIIGEFIDTNIFSIENKTLLTLIGFFIILVVVWTSAISIGKVLSRLTNLSGLGFLNNLLGMVAGGGKYFVIFALIAASLSNIALVKDNIAPAIKQSVLYPVLVASGSFLINLDYKQLQDKTLNLANEKPAQQSNVANKTKAKP
ncbi:MAG TPA: CvpA family protein [Epsilonproteobacteria bacterium]|nr:CvpA family protein [Campylobacterota bacterium]